ncbi:hypothetical protein PIB30_022092 [Stylosanthes scabra]|uniref:Uncharacterized protein n=1 Tax=Stylosanthes scabra TaxID=79078 RepID=A0ABU6R9A8_9FABA|nr:hypothetical protein [Stylosanthes scabra]
MEKNVKRNQEFVVGEFTRRFKWDPIHNATFRTNFEKKGAAKLLQLFQQVRREGTKPVWMEDIAYADLVKIWESSEYKKLSETNKKNLSRSVFAYRRFYTS